jgi:23S rRNA pseudouridine1911/1915/1917 synthase
VSEGSTVEIPFEVRRWEHGLRIDVFLAKRIGRMSRTLAARLVRTGRVRRVSGPDRLRPSQRVAEGDVLVLRRKTLVEGSVHDIVIPVLYEDRRVMAVNKPGDLVVHPTASAYHRTLIRIMRDRTGDEQLDLAHRIDKETSGLILMARDFDAASDLKQQFARREVDKCYLAVVRGRVESERFDVDAPLRLADSVTNVVMEVAPGGGEAFTSFRVLARSATASLVEARPRTGRQHQIRVHLSHTGHPILGDKLYLGGEGFFMDALAGAFEPEVVDDVVGHGRQALHAHAVTFRHPESGEATTLTAPLTPDLVALAQRHGLRLPAAA